MLFSESNRRYTIEVSIKLVDHLQFMTYTMSHEDGTVFYRQYKKLDLDNAGIYLHMASPSHNIIANLPTIGRLVKGQYVGPKGSNALHTRHKFFALLRLKFLHFKLKYLQFKQKFVNRRE